jgi:hypothetical protein
MIYCNLKGGLGNMFFQIAASKSMSIVKQTECSFPNLREHLDFLNRDTTHNTKLNHANEYLSFLNLNTENIQDPYNIKLYRYPFEYASFVPQEDTFCIDGFFQSEKYFKNHRAAILDIFRPTKEIELEIESKFEFVKSQKCTSLHVRRGDYLKFSNHHPQQDVEYYAKAIELIPETELLVIFSDDIEWCKENIRYKNSIFIENQKDYIELFLMSKCQNNIISNSSFSWWGAWLNQNTNKIVVGPDRWFGPELSHLSARDVIPEEWIKI